jgi:nucleoside-diphosphate-sugar epimerase
MPKNILVTGGAGYLGSILTPELLNKNYKVTVVDNFMYSQSSLNYLCSDNNFNIIKGDVRIESLMRPLIKSADIIIPLAAYVGAPLCLKDPIGATTVNHDSVITLIKNLSKDQMVLMPTTNSAYGQGDKNNFCTEESSLNPISTYAKDKVAIEKELLEKHANTISFRLATVFGMSPRMRIDLLVNDFVYRAVYDRFIVLFEPHFKRNYIHIRDVSRAFIHGIDNFSKMRGQIYNLGLSDANLSKLELCNKIQKYLPEFVFQEASYGKDLDQRNYIVSNAKIEATGFKTGFTLDNGIIELIKGYKMIKNSNYANV